MTDFTDYLQGICNYFSFKDKEDYSGPEYLIIDEEIRMEWKYSKGEGMFSTFIPRLHPQPKTWKSLVQYFNKREGDLSIYQKSTFFSPRYSWKWDDSKTVICSLSFYNGETSCKQEEYRQSRQQFLNVIKSSTADVLLLDLVVMIHDYLRLSEKVLNSFAKMFNLPLPNEMVL